jgi:predicted esterase
MRLFYIILFITLINTAYAAYPNMIDKNASTSTQWIFSRANACLQADNISRIAANGECLALQTYYASTAPSSHPILLIFIHGDGVPGGGPSDYLKYQATKFSKPNVVPVILIRPGYYDSYGQYSTGESYAFNHNGYPGDNYPPQTIATLAAAVSQLKEFYHPRCTILIGHSGGAIMSGVIMGKYPGLANGAVLASVINNVQQWADKHGYGLYPNSLSPDKFIGSIPKKAFIYIISGTADTNTYPEMAKKYFDLLEKQGVQAYWRPVTNGDHNSIVLSQTIEFDKAIEEAISQCP